MSLVSVLPFQDTLRYWWRELEGEPGRLTFMAFKVLEVSAFLGNHLLNKWQVERTRPPVFSPEKPLNQVHEDAMVVVVVPVRCRTEDDARRLDALVDALEGQTRPCEVVLVDDGSDLWRVEDGPDVLRLEENMGPAAARNKGVARALELGADVIALTDADCMPAPDWTQELVDALLVHRNAHAISGTTYSRDRSSLGRYHERNGTLNGRRHRGVRLS